MQKWIYVNDQDNRNRYVLGHWDKHPLLCIGVNPSTATPKKADATIRSVARTAEYNCYDGWIMINLYPQRATNPDDVDIEPNEAVIIQNLTAIETILQMYDIGEIWAAWGNLIEKRSYFKDCLRRIHSLADSYRWIRIGALTKAGNPRHPLYLSKDATVQEFDITDYIRKMR